MRGRGFTLIEMLVALVLVSLMSVGMLQAYRFSQKSLAQTTRMDAGTREIAAAQRALRRLIEQAYPFEPAGSAGAVQQPGALVGAANALTLSAPASASSSSAGLYRYSLERSDTGSVVVSWWLDRNGAAAVGAISREDLLEDVAAISIAYLELVERGDGQVETHWRDDWTDKARLPSLVRVRVEFTAGDRRRWPEFVVAPRLTADANCVFDVVSQMCRIAS